MNKIQHLFLFLIISAIFLIPAPGSAFDLELLEQDVEELSARLDEVEKQTLLDKIQIGAEIRTRADWYRYLDHDNDIDDGASAQSTRFRLNMKAEPTENLRFHARLTMFKNWIDNDALGFPVRMDFNNSRVPSDSTLKVERAYMDYFFDILPIAVSIGRLPVTDGLPTELKENTQRKSVYPSMAYDVEADGVAITLLLEEYIPMPDMILRFLYTNFTSDDDLYFFRDDTIAVKSMDFYMGQFETGFPGIFKDTIFIANYIYVPDVVSPGQPFPDNIIAPQIAAAGGIPVSMVVIDPDASYLPDSLGNMSRYILLLESKNFLNTWLDLFACYGNMRVQANGNGGIWVENFATVPPNAPPGNQVMVPFGLGSSLNIKGTKKGECIYYGARLNIPLDKINKKLGPYSPKIGYEYNKGSRYWIGSSWGAEDPFNKLNTRGHAHDFYYIQPIDKNFSIRAGHTEIDYDYANSGSYYEAGTSLFGPEKINTKATNTYLLLDMKF